MNRPWRYILSSDGFPEAIPDDDKYYCRQKEWGKTFETGINKVAETKFRDIRISTVFLGLDHNFAVAGPPVLWETMVFGGPEDIDGDTWRYVYRHQAVEGHINHVAEVHNIVFVGGYDSGNIAVQEYIPQTHTGIPHYFITSFRVFMIADYELSNPGAVPRMHIEVACYLCAEGVRACPVIVSAEFITIAEMIDELRCSYETDITHAHNWDKFIRKLSNLEIEEKQIP